MTRAKKGKNKQQQQTATNADTQPARTTTSLELRGPVPTALPPKPDTLSVTQPEKQQLIMDHCEFRLSPIHGYGVFAHKDISAGTLIIQEEALWVVDRDTAIQSTITETCDVLAARHALFESFQTSHLDEHTELIVLGEVAHLCGGFSPGAHIPDDQTLSEYLREILILNGFAASPGQDRRDPTYVAVFQASSRLNHSCVPNAELVKGRAKDGLVWCEVRTTSPVKAGEEILVNYVDPLAKSGFRQNLFQSRWRFTCTCHLCTRPQNEINASDERREKMQRARDVIQHASQRETMQGDRITIGAAGWEALDRLAEQEGVSDLKLWNSIYEAAQAARRLKKGSLEKRLVDRLMELCRTSAVGKDLGREVEDWRENIRVTAQCLLDMLGG